MFIALLINKINKINKQNSCQDEIYELIKFRSSFDLLNVKTLSKWKMYFSKYSMPVLILNNTKLLKCLTCNVTNGFISAVKPNTKFNNDQVNQVP